MEDVNGEIVEDISPPYFAVSLLKFCVMSLCTFGLYEVWWFYINWCRIKQRENSNIMPAWRAIFTVLWAYPCLTRIRDTSKSLDPKIWMPAGPLFVSWFVTLAFSRAPLPYELVSLLSFVWLLPAQIAANRINHTVAPGHDPNDRFSGWNIAAIVIGGLTLLLALIGIFVKPPGT